MTLLARRVFHHLHDTRGVADGGEQAPSHFGETGICRFLGGEEFVEAGKPRVRSGGGVLELGVALLDVTTIVGGV